MITPLITYHAHVALQNRLDISESSNRAAEQPRSGDHTVLLTYITVIIALNSRSIRAVRYFSGTGDLFHDRF